MQETWKAESVTTKHKRSSENHCKQLGPNCQCLENNWICVIDLLQFITIQIQSYRQVDKERHK